MGAVTIVKAFDVIKDLGACLVAGDEVAAVNQFQLAGAPEAFHGGVVVAVAFAAHGGHQACLTEGTSVIGAGVLDTPIGMKQQIYWRLPMPEGHGQSF